MATTHDPKSSVAGKTSPTSKDPRRLRWTKDEFYRLGRLGFFQDRRVELIDGEIMLMVTNPPHDTAVGLTARALQVVFGPDVLVRDQKALDVGSRALLYPDVAVVTGGLRDYATRHPTSALLVVEVSESTLRYDRLRKMRFYARAGIADYWIVNLVDRQLEIHRNPGPDPDHPYRHRYADVTIVPATGSASPLASPGAVFAVSDLLP